MDYEEKLEAFFEQENEPTEDEVNKMMLKAVQNKDYEIAFSLLSNFGANVYFKNDAALKEILTNKDYGAMVYLVENFYA